MILTMKVQHYLEESWMDFIASCGVFFIVEENFKFLFFCFCRRIFRTKIRLFFFSSDFNSRCIDKDGAKDSGFCVTIENFTMQRLGAKTYSPCKKTQRVQWNNLNKKNVKTKHLKEKEIPNNHLCVRWFCQMWLKYFFEFFEIPFLN